MLKTKFNLQLLWCFNVLSRGKAPDWLNLSECMDLPLQRGCQGRRCRTPHPPRPVLSPLHLDFWTP